MLLPIASKGKMRRILFFGRSAGSPSYKHSLKKLWRNALESLELDPMLLENQRDAKRSASLIADTIIGHGDRKKDVKSSYLTITDADLVREIDRLTFDHWKTEIWEQRDRSPFPHYATRKVQLKARPRIEIRGLTCYRLDHPIVTRFILGMALRTSR